MTSIEIAATIFCCLLLGAVAGMGLRGILPQDYLDPETRALIKLGVGLIGTMSALVLGLLVASTKGSYDTKRSELAQIAGNAILLDRVLAHYGENAVEIRDALRSTIAGMVGSNRAKNNLEQLDQAAPVGREVIFDKIQNLVPKQTFSAPFKPRHSRWRSTSAKRDGSCLRKAAHPSRRHFW